MSDALRYAFQERKKSDKKKSLDPRFGLEFKHGRPPLGRSDHLGNPVEAISIKKGGILKIANKLKKASKAHASQAQSLEKMAKMKKGGMPGTNGSSDSYYSKNLPRSYNEMFKEIEEEELEKLFKRRPFFKKMKKGGMPARNKKNFRSTKSGAGMTKAGVAAYRRMNPGSKLQTAVTGKVKPGSKAAKRRKSYCARSLGQLKRASAKTRNDPNSRIRQARRRWKC